jgi:hypothetical protein
MYEINKETNTIELHIKKFNELREDFRKNPNRFTLGKGGEGKNFYRKNNGCFNCNNAFYPNGEIAPIENKTCICGDKEFPIDYICDKWTEKDNEETILIIDPETSDGEWDNERN